MPVHVLDFSDLRAEGKGFAIEVEGTRCHPFAIAGDLYRGLVLDALAFFHLQRSGIAIDESRAPGYGRPAGHLADRSVEAWTGPDAERLYPGWSCPGRFDVSGGWYDAGDHGKYVTSGAMPVWQLLATVELIRRRGARMAWWARTEALLLEECRWQLDWLLRMQVPPGHAHAGLAFHRVHGTEWAPLPCRPHEDPTKRVLHRPSTAAALHLAAAAAHGARVFRTETPYARKLRAAAVTAHRAAHAEPLLPAPDDQGAFGGGPYADDDVADERAWAAAELWLATGATAYLEQARRALSRDVFALDGFDWNRMAAPAALDLALHGHAFVGRDRVVAGVAAAADRLIDLQRGQPWGQPYAPADGWDWGFERACAQQPRGPRRRARAHRPRRVSRRRDGRPRLRAGLQRARQSYVTGYGTDFTRHQRARHLAHDLDPSFPPPPSGALAGGPTSKEHPGFPSDARLAGLPPQCRYLDEIASETTNDVCIRWNAPLVWIAAFLTP